MSHLTALIEKTRKSKVLQVFITGAVSLAFFLTFAISGRAGDCKPHEVDGQCGGLSTFVGFVFGTFGALLILLVGATFIVTFWLREKRNRQLPARVEQ